VHLFEVGLEQPEPLHCQPACLFRESGQLVHTGQVCQIKLTTLCQLILKVSLTEHINRFGDYTLNLDRKPPQPDYGFTLKQTASAR
jgi:hypothetical protein